MAAQWPLGLARHLGETELRMRIRRVVGGCGGGVDEGGCAERCRGARSMWTTEDHSGTTTAGTAMAGTTMAGTTMAGTTMAGTTEPASYSTDGMPAELDQDCQLPYDGCTLSTAPPPAPLSWTRTDADVPSIPRCRQCIQSTVHALHAQ